MKIIVFGTGDYYQRYKEILSLNDTIIALIDNNPAINGTTIDSIRVYMPQEVLNLNYDAIVLCSIHCIAMKEQLLSYGVDEKKIYFIEKFCQKMNDKIEYLPSDYNEGNNRLSQKKVLLISTYLSCGGGSIVAVYACQLLQELGYQIQLAVPGAETSMIKEANNAGIAVTVYPCLPYISQRIYDMLGEFELVIVNVFQMIQSAVEISKLKPVLWWIHENGPQNCHIYPSIIGKFGQYKPNMMNKINIVGVSKQASDIFNSFYPQQSKRQMAFGIPDYSQAVDMQKNGANDGITFAVIGAISFVKAQKNFLKAVMRLDKTDRDKAKFYIIGASDDITYTKELAEMNESCHGVNIIYGMPKSQMMSFYNNIDVVVCCSMEETMCMTIIEGMMNRKATITTSTTGIASFMEDGINGLICQPDDIDELSMSMHRLICDEAYRLRLAENGRRLYEEYFTMEAFKKRLAEEIQYTLNHY